MKKNEILIKEIVDTIKSSLKGTIIKTYEFRMNQKTNEIVLVINGDAIPWSNNEN